MAFTLRCGLLAFTDVLHWLVVCWRWYSTGCPLPVIAHLVIAYRVFWMLPWTHYLDSRRTCHTAVWPFTWVYPRLDLIRLPPLRFYPRTFGVAFPHYYRPTSSRCPAAFVTATYYPHIVRCCSWLAFICGVRVWWYPTPFGPVSLPLVLPHPAPSAAHVLPTTRTPRTPRYLTCYNVVASGWRLDGCTVPTGWFCTTTFGIYLPPTFLDITTCLAFYCTLPHPHPCRPRTLVLPPPPCLSFVPGSAPRFILAPHLHCGSAVYYTLFCPPLALPILPQVLPAFGCFRFPTLPFIVHLFVWFSCCRFAPHFSLTFIVTFFAHTLCWFRGLNYHRDMGLNLPRSFTFWFVWFRFPTRWCLARCAYPTYRPIPPPSFVYIGWTVRATTPAVLTTRFVPVFPVWFFYLHLPFPLLPQVWFIAQLPDTLWTPHSYTCRYHVWWLVVPILPCSRSVLYLPVAGLAHFPDQLRTMPANWIPHLLDIWFLGYCVGSLVGLLVATHITLTVWTMPGYAIPYGSFCRTFTRFLRLVWFTPHLHALGRYAATPATPATPPYYLHHHAHTYTPPLTTWLLGFPAYLPHGSAWLVFGLHRDLPHLPTVTLPTLPTTCHCCLV